MITVINQSKRVITQTDLDTLTAFLEQYQNLVYKYWTKDPTQFIVEYKIIIVDRFPNPAMQRNLGYHEVVNGQPVAYIRVDAYGSRSIFGTYSKAFKFKGIQIHGERLIPGIVNVAAHELAEMLIDPFVTKLSPADNKGRTWVLEICDHTVGYFVLWSPTVNGIFPGIFPDFTLPSFYYMDGKMGQSPYSYLGVPTNPMVLIKGAYGYYRDKFGTHKL